MRDDSDHEFTDVRQAYLPEKGSYKAMLKTEPVEPEVKKPDEISQVDILKDWRLPVRVHRAGLVKPLEAAVDARISNIIADLINEFNVLEQKQYEDIQEINNQLDRQPEEPADPLPDLSSITRKDISPPAQRKKRYDEQD